MGLENGRWYWEGGGIGRGAIEGDDCIKYSAHGLIVEVSFIVEVS